MRYHLSRRISLRKSDCVKKTKSQISGGCWRRCNRGLVPPGEQRQADVRIPLLEKLLENSGMGGRDRTNQLLDGHLMPGNLPELRFYPALPVATRPLPREQLLQDVV